ncbi:MAG: PilW family protein, partial [Porticoccaceae bacterium]
SAPQNANEWQNIVAIKYYLLLSSNENGLAMADQASYNYADKTDVTFNDHKQRKLFYGFSRLRNSVSVRGDE